MATAAPRKGSFLTNIAPGSKSPPVLLPSAPLNAPPEPTIAVPHTFLSNRPVQARRSSTEADEPAEMASTETTVLPKPKFTPPPPNSVAFTTIPVTSLSHAQAFYSTVFGWTFPTPIAGEAKQAIFFTPGNSMGALTLSTVEKIAGGVVNYILVTDVSETLRKVVEAGGKVEKEPWVEGNHTELAQFRDSDGNLGGLLKWLI